MAGMIEARTLSYRHDGKSPWLFRDLSFRLETGHTLALLGRNGRGKTTLLRCLAGLLAPGAGTVLRSGAVGYVPQHFTSPFPYTVHDVVLMGRARHIGLLSNPTGKDRLRVKEALEAIGLIAFADRRIDTLSGGERQLALIARALASEAEILLLDEPASALDYHNQALILALLRRLARERGLTIVMTTHDPSHALEIAERAVLLHGNGLAEEGPIELVCREDRLTALYDITMRRLDFGSKDGASVSAIVPHYGSLNR